MPISFKPQYYRRNHAINENQGKPFFNFINNRYINIKFMFERERLKNQQRSLMLELHRKITDLIHQFTESQHSRDKE